MGAIRIPGEQHRAASIILDGRASSVGLSADARGWIERGRDSLARSCPNCSVNPINVVRVSILMACAWCACGAVVKMDLNSEPTRAPTRSKELADVALAVELRRLSAKARTRR